MQNMIFYIFFSWVGGEMWPAHALDRFCVEAKKKDLLLEWEQSIHQMLTDKSGQDTQTLLTLHQKLNCLEIFPLCKNTPVFSRTSISFGRATELNPFGLDMYSNISMALYVLSAAICRHKCLE